MTRKPQVTLTILVPFYLPVILNYDQDLQADLQSVKNEPMCQISRSVVIVHTDTQLIALFRPVKLSVIIPCKMEENAHITV